MPRLTEQQKRVISHVADNEITVVGAGAGAGKTFTTVEAVLDRLEDKDADVSLDQFVLITFTNEAADELRARLEQAVNGRIAAPIPGGRKSNFWREQSERLSAAYVGTIHGFCHQILRAFGYEAQVAREASPTFARYLRQLALRDAVEAHARMEQPLLLDDRFQWEIYELEKYVGTILEQARGRGYSIPQMNSQTAVQAEDRGKPWRVALTEIVTDAESRYQAFKQEQHRLDPDDLIGRVANLFSGPGGNEIAAKLRQRYRFLFLDEFQDTDQVQKRIVDAMVGVFDAVLVVGDGKQSIYRFRSADPSLLEAIAKEYKVPVLPLNLSRRPTLPLLEVQNALFRRIGDRPQYRELAAPLEASEDAIQPVGKIPPLTYVRDEEGPAATAQIIRDYIGRRFEDPRNGILRPAEPGDVVVLLRFNWQITEYLAQLSAALHEDEIEVRVEETGRFFHRPEIVATFRILRLILEYPDDMLLSLALRTPYLRGTDPIEEEQRLLHFPVISGNPLTAWFKRKHADLNKRIEDLRLAARENTVPQVIAQLYRDSEIREYYLARGDRQAAANLDKLRELARRLFGEEQALTLRQFVNYLQLSIETGQEESDALVGTDSEDADSKRPPYVRLMTIHGAKGLEFPFVILPEMHFPLRNRRRQPTFLLSRTDGLDFALPQTHENPREVEFTKSARFDAARAREMQEQVREEMRILYVAVTRAQHAVAMIGSPQRQINSPSSHKYSWQDEVLRAERDISRLGAVFL